MSSPIQVNYPLREGKVSKWTREYKIQYDREYRQKIKDGLITPRVIKEDSKWRDKEFRNAYDKSRKQKKSIEKHNVKMDIEQCKERVRPNYNKEQKEIILMQMLDDIKQGKEPSHPYFKLGLQVIEKRTRNKNSQEVSS